MKIRILTAFFPVRAEADAAFLRLAALGVTPDELSIIPKHVNHRNDLGIAVATKTAEGVAFGAITGALLCGVLGAIAAAGAIVIPGLGSVLAGPLVAGLAAAGAGGAVGGILGALLGARTPEYEAKVLQDAVNIGGALMAVRCADPSAQRIARALLASGGMCIRYWAVRR